MNKIEKNVINDNFINNKNLKKTIMKNENMEDNYYNENNINIMKKKQNKKKLSSDENYEYEKESTHYSSTENIDEIYLKKKAKRDFASKKSEYSINENDLSNEDSSKDLSDDIPYEKNKNNIIRKYNINDNEFEQKNNKFFMNNKNKNSEKTKQLIKNDNKLNKKILKEKNNINSDDYFNKRNTNKVNSNKLNNIKNDKQNYSNIKSRLLKDKNTFKNTTNKVSFAVNNENKGLNEKNIAADKIRRNFQTFVEIKRKKDDKMMLKNTNDVSTVRSKNDVIEETKKKIIRNASNSLKRYQSLNSKNLLNIKKKIKMKITKHINSGPLNLFQNMMGLDEQGKIHTWNGCKWVLVCDMNKRLLSVSTDDKGHLLCIDENNLAGYIMNNNRFENFNSWINYGFIKIITCNNKKLWAINLLGELMILKNFEWVIVKKAYGISKLKIMAFDRKNDLWVLDVKNYFYVYNVTDKTWLLKKINGTNIKDFDFDENNSMVAVTDNGHIQIYKSKKWIKYGLLGETKIFTIHFIRQDHENKSIES